MIFLYFCGGSSAPAEYSVKREEEFAFVLA